MDGAINVQQRAYGDREQMARTLACVLVLASALFPWVTVPSFAQPVGLTLEQALAEALARNPASRFGPRLRVGQRELIDTREAYLNAVATLNTAAVTLYRPLNSRP